MASQGEPRTRGKATSLRSWLGYALLRLGSLVVRILGVSAASSLTGLLFRTVGPLTRRHPRIATNLALALPHTAAEDRTLIASRQWDSLGRTLAETLGMAQIVGDPVRFELIVAPDLDRKLRQRGSRGVVFVSCHMANWEAAAYPLNRYGKIAGLYQRLTDPLAEAYVRSLRELAFQDGMLPKEPETVRRTMMRVRAGGSVGMLADLYEKRGIRVDFFGHPTSATPFPAMLARRLDALLVTVHMTRLPHSRFRTELEEIVVPVTDDVTDDVRATTQAVLARFEAWIRASPGDWMWVQNRWRATSERNAGR